MNGADRHLDYHRQRGADLMREAGRRDLALQFSAARDAERRSFLAHAWQKRFRRHGAGRVIEAPPATT
jgi:hypothetical protein